MLLDRYFIAEGDEAALWTTFGQAVTAIAFTCQPFAYAAGVTVQTSANATSAALGVQETPKPYSRSV
ncbi:MAG: hypothetical protein ACLUI3_10400 [Christensenellales bacterium]